MPSTKIHEDFIRYVFCTAKAKSEINLTKNKCAFELCNCDNFMLLQGLV